MKKHLTFLFVLWTSISLAQFTTVWKKTTGDVNLPTWFTASNNNVRGIAYGNGHLYFVQRNSGTTIRIVNPTDGSDVGVLDNGTGIISGGTFTMSDVEVSSNGDIFAANLTTNSTTSAFKIYRWTSEGGTPTNVISYTGLAFRMGDNFTVVGSTADNSAIIYAPAALSSSVVKFTTTDNGASWTPTTISLSDVANGNGPAITPVSSSPTANFYVKSGGLNVKEYASDGTFQATLPGGIVSTSNIDVAYFTSGANKFVATVQFGATATDNRINLGDVTLGTASATLYGSSVSLGTYNNAANGGDCAVKDNGNGTFDIFILSPGNGFAAVRTSTAPLPVELTSFTAIAKGHRVELVWETATEVNNHGFEIEKNIGGSWNKVGFVEGAGTTNAPKLYSFIDASVKGTVLYRLKQIDRDGKFEYSKSVEATVADIKTFGLDQNYPNPFNPNTVISYQLPLNSAVTLVVYDAIGREVATVVNEVKEAGTYSVQFDGSKLSSGIYFYTFRAGQFTATKKLSLLK